MKNILEAIIETETKHKQQLIKAHDKANAIIKASNDEALAQMEASERALETRSVERIKEIDAAVALEQETLEKAFESEKEIILKQFESKKDSVIRIMIDEVFSHGNR